MWELANKKGRLLPLLLHRAFWRFTEYYTPMNALIMHYMLA